VKRRAFLATPLALSPLAAAAAGIDVIYIGADDCFYCQHWEAARKPELLELFRGTGVKLVEIHGETVSKPVTEKFFPPLYRWVHRAIGDVTFLPSFVLAVNGKIVLKVRGTSNYSEIFEPKMRAILARDHVKSRL